MTRRDRLCRGTKMKSNSPSIEEKILAWRAGGDNMTGIPKKEKLVDGADDRFYICSECGFTSGLVVSPLRILNLESAHHGQILCGPEEPWLKATPRRPTRGAKIDTSLHQGTCYRGPYNPSPYLHISEYARGERRD